MKKLILIGIMVFHSFSTAADKDEPNKRRKLPDITQQETSFGSLPDEIKILIIQQLILANFDFDKSIENILHLTQTNTTLRTWITQGKPLESILDLLSDQLKISRAGIAFALNTPWSLAWIKKQNNISREEILREILLNTTNINILGSNQLLLLAEQLGTTPLNFALSLINENSQGLGFFHPGQIVQNPQSNLYKSYRAFCLLFVILQNQITPSEMRSFGLNFLGNVEALLIEFLKKETDESLKEKMKSALKKIDDFAAGRMR